MCSLCDEKRKYHKDIELSRKKHRDLYKRNHPNYREPGSWNWAKEYDCCIKCGTTKIKHKAKGLCSFCYPFAYRKLNIESIKKYDKDYFQKLKRENPELIKERRVKWNRENPEKAKASRRKSDKKRNKRILLKDGRWSEKYDCCIKCGTKEKRHLGKGLCKCCHVKQRKEMFPEVKKRYNEYSKEYNKKKYAKRKGGLCQYLLDELNKELEKEKKEKKRKVRKIEESIIRYEKRIELRKIPYHVRNKEKINKNKIIRFRKRMRTDPEFRLKQNTSKSVRKKLKNHSLSKECKPTWKFLPYTVEELMQHLEKLFTEGMTRENYGKWHVDHKKPDCLFNYKSVDDEEFQKCWALENLQPLWAIDNTRKGSKY